MKERGEGGRAEQEKKDCKKVLGREREREREKGVRACVCRDVEILPWCV